MSKTTTKDAIHISQEPHSLKCVLTSEEKGDAAIDLANSYQALESLAIEKKVAMTLFKQRKEQLEEQTHVTSIMVKEGVALRQVQCELRLNYTKLRATFVRLDTGQTVEERDMTPEEKQMKMQFDKDGKKSKKARSDMQKKVKTEELQFENKKTK